MLPIKVYITGIVTRIVTFQCLLSIILCNLEVLSDLNFVSNVWSAFHSFISCWITIMVACLAKRERGGNALHLRTYNVIT